MVVTWTAALTSHVYQALPTHVFMQFYILYLLFLTQQL